MRRVATRAGGRLCRFGAPRRRAAAQLPVPVLVEGLADWRILVDDGQFEFAHAQRAGIGRALARVQLWGAIEPLPGLVFYGQGEFEAGPASIRAQRSFDVVRRSIRRSLHRGAARS